MPNDDDEDVTLKRFRAEHQSLSPDVHFWCYATALHRGGGLVQVSEHLQPLGFDIAICSIRVSGNISRAGC